MNNLREVLNGVGRGIKRAFLLNYLRYLFSNAMKAKLFLFLFFFLENFIYFIKIKVQQFFKKV